MARCVKDLREIVCVSRLTLRDEEDDEEDLSRPMTSLSMFEHGAPLHRCKSFNIKRGKEEDPRYRDLTFFAPKLLNTKPDPNSSNKYQEVIQRSPTPANDNFDFRNFKSPLPPVRNSSGPSSKGSQTSVMSVDSLSRVDSMSWDDRLGYFDDVLQHVPDEMVNDWLKRANQSVANLVSWTQLADNFVSFCHFWLTEFSLDEQVSLLRLEISICLDEFGFALQDTIKEGKMHESDLKNLFSALFPEYPKKLCSPRGQYIFLNILDTLSSDKSAEYRRLLTDVKLYTNQRHLAQTALAMRAFIMINIWNNAVQFYVKAVSGKKTNNVPDRQSSASNDSKNSKIQQDMDYIFQAVRRGYVRVLHYLLRSSYGSVTSKDEQGRSVVFTSVLYNQPQVLRYLLSKHSDRLSLNEPCKSGNSALHVAASLYHTECLSLLLQSEEIDVNHRNIECEGATPLHMAVMQDNAESVGILLEAGADRTIVMNGVSPISLANTLGLADITQLLQE